MVNQQKTTVPTLNPILRDFWTAKYNEAGEPIRNRVLYGGRASSKSWDAAGFVIFLANSFRLRILCARQFQNKIEESVYSLLKIQIFRYGLQHRFKILNNKIINLYTGSEFLFYGLWKNIDEIKSLESIDICWLEEAHNITQAQWDILEPTVRKEDSQFWIIFNPKLASDFVYKRFVVNPPAGTLVRKINYTGNPFLSQTMLNVIVNAEREDPESHTHIYLGVPLDNDERAVIRRLWVMAAIDAHIRLGFEAAGAKRIGFDIADAGQDKCATVSAHGSVVTGVSEWKAKEDELLKSCTHAYRLAAADDALIVYDSIGVGASAGAKFNEINADKSYRVQHSKFNAGAAVWKPDAKYAKSTTTNKDMFSNLKAQAWWLLADRFKNTYNAVINGQQFEPADMISISSTCAYLDQLIEELCTPLRDYAADGRVKVESKQDLAKRDVPSPNLADALVMATTPTIRVGLKMNSDILNNV